MAFRTYCQRFVPALEHDGFLKGLTSQIFQTSNLVNCNIIAYGAAQFTSFRAQFSGQAVGLVISLVSVQYIYLTKQRCFLPLKISRLKTKLCKRVEFWHQ